MMVRQAPVTGTVLRYTKRTRTGKVSGIQQERINSLWKKALFLILLTTIIILASGFIITLGQIDITVPDVYRTLINKLDPGLFSIDPGMDHIIWQIRFPLIAGATLAGFGLGICGCVMQAVLKNPLASPFTLGISTGAQFGISLAAVLGITILGGPYFLVGNAFFFALLCSGIILVIAGMKGGTSEIMILVGIAMTYFFSAMTQILSYLATEGQLLLMQQWGMGSLTELTWNSIFCMGFVMIICIPLLYRNAWDLNLMTVGDESAKSLGVNADQVRLSVMGLSSLLVATVVAFVGVIGFIGLVAPHIGRILLGSDHRYLIPAAGGIGAFLLLIAEAISMNLFGTLVIPTGIIMSVIGVPFFLYIILRGKRREFWS